MLSWGSTGPILQTLNSDGVTVNNTLQLPSPDKAGGMIFSWESLGKEIKLYDGTSTIVYPDPTKRYKPKLVLKYKNYDGDLAAFCDNPNGVGLSSGQTPTFDQLLSTIGTYNMGQMQIQRASGEPFFKCYIVKTIDLNPIVGFVYTNVTLEFVGYNGYANMVLV